MQAMPSIIETVKQPSNQAAKQSSCKGKEAADWSERKRQQANLLAQLARRSSYCCPIDRNTRTNCLAQHTYSCRVAATIYIQTYMATCVCMLIPMEIFTCSVINSGIQFCGRLSLLTKIWWVEIISWNAWLA